MLASCSRAVSPCNATMRKRQRSSASGVTPNCFWTTSFVRSAPASSAGVKSSNAAVRFGSWTPCAELDVIARPRRISGDPSYFTLSTETSRCTPAPYAPRGSLLRRCPFAPQATVSPAVAHSSLLLSTAVALRNRGRRRQPRPAAHRCGHHSIAAPSAQHMAEACASLETPAANPRSRSMPSRPMASSESRRVYIKTSGFFASLARGVCFRT
mmetsp:Transcript_22733/g.76841  ORF Transcript_22733/g.76841 Transcript_22733/m.76841 type:complete len:212 (-) Transcript_22733:286-921(-)